MKVARDQARRSSPKPAVQVLERGKGVYDTPSPPGLGLDETRRARFPQALQERFRGRRFIPVDPPDFLNYEGAEILLIGASQDVSAELGLRLNPEQETEATAEILRDLRIEKSLHPTTPLFAGKWV